LLERISHQSRPASTPAITAPVPQVYEPAYQRFNLAEGTGGRPQNDVPPVRPWYRQPVPIGPGAEWSYLSRSATLRCPICNCGRTSQGCGCGD
jgi:hypothetical protein